MSIFLELKNIKSLLIKIYKIEPEAYYVNNFKEIDNEFDLAGIVPNNEKTIEFTDPPRKKFETEIKFSKISAEKNGIFFVDFFGGGLSARAIIKKGKIHLFKKETLVGLAITIYDENLIQIKKGKLGIWVKSHFYRANKSGEIIIPYGKTIETVDVVISVENNAFLDTLKILKEEFVFSFELLYCPESIIPNNIAKFFIQAK